LLLLFQITGEFGFDFLDAGETGIEGLGQGTDELVFGHADGLVGDLFESGYL
jgi:hypothetical protein